MPWDIRKGFGRCGPDKWAVVKQGTDEIEGCHTTEASAKRQQAALYASEPRARAASVSNRPWSDFTEGDYSDAQWIRACILDRGPDAGTAKQRYAVPVREPSGVLNRNGVHAAAGGHGLAAVKGASGEAKRAAARKLVSLYRNDLDEDPPEGLLRMAGEATSSRSDPGELLVARPCSRTFQLEDLTVRSDGSGRVVESYFAVFAPIRSEVVDQDGHYMEENHPSLFNRTLQHRGLNIPVFYNHARTLDGTPDGYLSIPIGKPLEIKADERGVFNAVQYLDNDLANSVLDGIRHKVINGMSYSGRYTKSVRSHPQGRGRGRLPLIVRHEAELREFGPTAIPQFPEAEILNTRAQQVLRMLLANPTNLTASDYALLGQQEGLTTPDGDPEAPPPDTPTDEAGPVPADDPQPRLHSARSLAQRIRVARIARGIE